MRSASHLSASISARPRPVLEPVPLAWRGRGRRAAAAVPDTPAAPDGGGDSALAELRADAEAAFETLGEEGLAAWLIDAELDADAPRRLALLRSLSDAS